MPTARELTREEWQPYLAAARRQLLPTPSPAYDHPERQQLLLRIEEAATVLKECFGVRRVILFGSVAHPAWFTPDSDVDLAVEGLAGAD